ncbi:uncharacterized protein [Primulina eburnea]|uniref:uncharacterized protein n=1 Tax=Primulina eburnea TaxID=1245227 RepID=UPI003C6C47E0
MMEYQIQTPNGQNVVDLAKKECSCGRFQLCGYPCAHACAAIREHRTQVSEFVHQYYKKEAYLRTYSYMIHAVPGEDDYCKTEYEPLGPPEVKKRAGRPKKKRKKGVDEVQKTSTRQGLTTHALIAWKRAIINLVAQILRIIGLGVIRAHLEFKAGEERQMHPRVSEQFLIRAQLLARVKEQQLHLQYHNINNCLQAHFIHGILYSHNDIHHPHSKNNLLVQQNHRRQGLVVVILSLLVLVLMHVLVQRHVKI